MAKDKVINFFKRFTIFDYCLLLIGLCATITVSIIFKGNIFAIFTSVLGITGVFFTAKGYIIGAFLAILQCLFYSVIAFKNAFYGEVIIYLAFLIPLNIVIIFQWLKNRSKQDKMVVKINKISFKEIALIFFGSVIIFVAGYFILKAFNTANLILSTISVTVGIVGNYLNLRRDKRSFYVFITNNSVVIVMWLVYAIQSNDFSVLPLIICCCTNIVSNIYGIINWTKLYKKQNLENAPSLEDANTF